MQDTFRLRVLKALTSSLEEISTADGYANDLAGKVFRGREHFGDGDPIPLVSVFEKLDLEWDGRTVEDRSSGGTRSQTRLDLVIQGFVKDDPMNPLDPAYAMIGDLHRRLTEEAVRRTDRRFDILGMGNRIVSMEVGQGGTMKPSIEASDHAFAYVPVRLTFVEDRSKPLD